MQWKRKNPIASRSAYSLFDEVVTGGAVNTIRHALSAIE
jgi:hypothetical protein